MALRIHNGDSQSYSARVAHVVTPYKIIINKGSSNRIRRGDTFIIYELSDEDITDPETGESLGKFELVRGYGKVTHVESNKATIESNERSSSTKILKRQQAPSRAQGVLEQIYSFYPSLYTMPPSQEELIEEQGEILSFDNVQVGDFVRPI